MLETDAIAQLLDHDFGVASHEENLTGFSIREECREYVYPPFLERTTWLFTHNSTKVEEVVTGVFLTARFLERVPQNSLVVTHHHYDYHEDDRGLQPLSADTLRSLRDRGVSIYVLHAPLDTHPVYGTSKVLADYCGIAETERFFDYFGAPAALIGTVPRQSVDDFARVVMNALQRPDLTIHAHRLEVERIAVVAGGGDMPEILQYAHDKQCDTMLTGTVANRWGLLKDTNRDFLSLNEECKLNLIGGTHYGTERPAMVSFVGFFEQHGIPSRYVEDDLLLSFPDTQ